MNQELKDDDRNVNELPKLIIFSLSVIFLLLFSVFLTILFVILKWFV